jgi:hypothetical protein
VISNCLISLFSSSTYASRFTAPFWYGFSLHFTKFISMEDHIKGDNTIKNPDDWKTGDEPMTGAQRSYLHTLASEAKETVDEHLSKAEAVKKIEELQEKTGRGQ